MKGLLKRSLRIADRIAQQTLPSRIYLHLRRASIAAQKKYRVAPTPLLAPFEINKKNEIAAPIGSFVTTEGQHLQLNLEQLITHLKETPSNACELVLCCAFQGRHNILKNVVLESLSGIEGANVRWMLVGSTPEDLSLIHLLSDQTGKVAGCIVANRPLGRKWQSCVRFANAYFNAQLYGIVGSDDIVPHKLVDYIIRRHRHNKASSLNERVLPAMYATMEWLVLHNDEKANLVPKIMRCNYAFPTAFQPLGAGRFYTRFYIEQMKGCIFDSTLDKLLDDRGYFDTLKLGGVIEYFGLSEGPLISVKGDWSLMNSVDDFLEANTLALREYSFEGHDLIRGSVSDKTYAYLFRKAESALQLAFANGLDVPFGCQ